MLILVLVDVVKSSLWQPLIKKCCAYFQALTLVGIVFSIYALN
jgi:hypothetical protein